MKLSLLSLTLTLMAAAACSSGADGGSGDNGKDGKQGAPGENAPPPAEGDQALSLVTPSKGILDREIEVSIGGNGTKFQEGAKPNFGPGIEVLEVTTSSPSLITAKIRILADALVGPRTVAIGTLTAEKAFSVIPAINVVGAADVAQGGLIQFKIENNDSRAFDANAFALEVGDLMDLGSAANGPQSATGFLLAPPLAKTGKSQVSVMNLGADGKPSLSFLSATDAVGVTARTPAAFTLGVASEESFGSATETKLFKLGGMVGGETSIVDYRIEVGADDGAVPVAFVFGTGGTKNDRLGQVLPGQNPFTGEFDPAPYDLHVALPTSSTQAADQYVVLASLSGTANAKAKITASRSAAAIANESGTPHTSQSPQLVGAITSDLGQVVNANLAGAGEVDVYKFTVADTSAKLQLVASSDADLEIILTKDPTVLSDPDGTPAANKKVLGAIYPGKQFAAQKALAAALGSTEIYAVVRYDAEQGKVQTGKYTLGMRKLP